MTPPVRLADAVRRLQVRLGGAAADSVAEFEAATGVTPTRLEIEMLDATAIGDVLRRRCVGRVRVDLGDF